MDDQGTLKTYGNMELPEGTEERPLVTFALFAYNQEKYIREAVEGAFSQTYSPLEVILSDDCSSDRTFEIIENMAQEYEGPARVVIRSGDKNLGLARHFEEVVNLANGDYIVVSAGDDVSLPDRTAELVQTMLREGTLFAASNYSLMLECGKVINSNLSNDYSGNYVWQIVRASPSYFANGAAACYKKDFLLGAFASIKKTIMSEKIFNEDIIFAAYGVAIGVMPSEYCDRSLLKYRDNSSSLSNFRSRKNDFDGVIATIRREMFRASSRQASLHAILEMASNFSRLDRKLDKERIRADLRRSNIEIIAYDKNFFRRVVAFFLVRNFEEFRIVAARMFGVRFLAIIRLVRFKIDDVFSRM
ncbi:glycosyltransferase [Thioclava nitratireducens]|uniref:glycosyltransferase n=1 Tax=Thioclava nitratireducens TaxID=1915078 RepID=UPI0024812B03|nr:glycosyltransferase [Thioclava nitratireducens]WGT51485.1 glycosyltransferase [Thioclava nitratireducens]